MKFRKVNKKSKLDVIQSKMGLLRVKLSSGFTQKAKEGENIRTNYLTRQMEQSILGMWEP